MIGKFFRWCFNLLRTFSFFLVLAFVSLLAIGHYFPQWRLDAWLESPSLEEEIVMQSNVPSVPNSPESTKKKVAVSIDVNSSDIIEIREHPRSFNKLEFRTAQEDLLLRASEIVIIESDATSKQQHYPYYKLTDTSAEQYSLHERTHNLKQIWAELPDTSHFFKVKNAIINCDYIKKRNRIDFVVVMENRQRLRISRNAFKKLEKHMKEFKQNKMDGEDKKDS